MSRDTTQYYNSKQDGDNVGHAHGGCFVCGFDGVDDNEMPLIKSLRGMQIHRLCLVKVLTETKHHAILYSECISINKKLPTQDRISLTEIENIKTELQLSARRQEESIQQSGILCDFPLESPKPVKAKTPFNESDEYNLNPLGPRFYIFALEKGIQLNDIEDWSYPWMIFISGADACLREYRRVLDAKNGTLVNQESSHEETKPLQQELFDPNLG